MKTGKFVISYDDFISEEFFSQFLTEAQEAGVPVEIESRASGPRMGVEWMLAAAVVVFVGKPFVDDILKRTAKDVGDYVYPKIKNAISTLATQVLRNTNWRYVTTSGEKPREGRSGFFTIISESREGLKVQFVFEEGRASSEYDTAVDQALRVLRDHHLGGSHDPLANAPIAWRTTIYMGFDHEKQVWIPINVYEEVAKEAGKSRRSKSESGG